MPDVHPRLRKRLARCTLDCGFKTSESPALRDFVAERGPITGTSLYLVLKSNGLRHPKNLPVKFGFSSKSVPANTAQKLPLQRCFKPFLVSLFNFSHKRPTFAFTGESGYTHSAFGERSHTRAHTAKQGAFQMGGGITTLGAFHTFRKPCVAGYQNGKLCRFWALVGGALEERREPAGQRCAHACRCSEASRPRWAAQLYLFIGVFTFVKDLAGCCQYSSPITKGAADFNIRIGTLSGHDQNTPRRSKIQKLNAMRQHIRVLQCMALRLSG